jgi:hypothetical protein
MSSGIVEEQTLIEVKEHDRRAGYAKTTVCEEQQCDNPDFFSLVAELIYHERWLRQ